MQISLSHVLTPARVDSLSALGWRLDPNFGNYVRIFASDAAAGQIADAVLPALGEGYEADASKLEIRVDWVADSDCPTRNGPSQNLAGAISDSSTDIR